MSSEAFEDESVLRATGELKEEAPEENPFVAPFQEEEERKKPAVEDRPPPPQKKKKKKTTTRAVEQFVESTLDEPVMDTIVRDLKTIGIKIRHVMMPYESQEDTLDVLRDWDLWGPLFIGLFLAMLLAYKADPEQAELLFSLVFVLIWCGGAVVTLNASLLGGNLSFWQSVCVLGYSVVPLVLARALCVLVESFASSLSVGARTLLRTLLVCPALVWCTRVSVLFIGDCIQLERRALATYPVIFFYASLAWMVVAV
mmetsp:Transcript_12127/g.36563  ORF Transcript_12127/g.36563 Transcript_12127/m.36563 type:complete len:256 (+) Transcript_12127:75-842(+)